MRLHLVAIICLITICGYSDEGYMDADENIQSQDPRVRYYYYRQTDDANFRTRIQLLIFLSFLYFARQTQMAIQLIMLLADPRMPYCTSLPLTGIYGRDHGNGEVYTSRWSS